MHRLIPDNLSFILLLFLLISCQQNQGAESIPPIEAGLDSLGSAILDEGDVVGFSVAIMQGEDTVYNQGFGHKDLDKRNPVTNDTRFLMASVSKLIGATLTMKLIEEGQLALDQTLLELLPEFPNKEQAEKITLEHMISHTSGLPDYATEIDSMYVQTGLDPTEEDYFNFFEGKDLLFEPGTNYSYCNSGFLLMGIIIERVTGNSFQDEIDRVINQLTSMNLKLIAEATYDPQMSPYWERKSSGFISYPHWTWIEGDGGLTATSIMLCQFPRQWASGKVINKASFDEMTEPRVLLDGVQTGYGLGVRNGEFYGEKIIGHTGGHKSTYAIMVYFPKRDLSFVVFVNTDNTPMSVRKVFGRFASTYLGYGPPNQALNKKPLGDPERYVGAYGAYDEKIAETITITLNETKELSYCIGDKCYPMTYLGDHRFWIAEWPYDYVTFHVDEKGQSLAIKEYYTGFYSILRKRVNVIANPVNSLRSE